MKQKLVDRYESQLFVAEMDGKKDIVCFRDTANSIINVNKQWYEKKEKPEDEAERIIKTAAKLIFGEIRSTKFNNGYYPPTVDELSSSLGFSVSSAKVKSSTGHFEAKTLSISTPKPNDIGGTQYLILFTYVYILSAQY